MVGLANVDNANDARQLASTAAVRALSNIDSHVIGNASLANPCFVGAVTTPNLTVACDAAVYGNLSVSGIHKIMTSGRTQAIPFNNLELGGAFNVGHYLNSSGVAIPNEGKLLLKQIYVAFD